MDSDNGESGTMREVICIYRYKEEVTYERNVKMIPGVKRKKQLSYCQGTWGENSTYEKGPSENNCQATGSERIQPKETIPVSKTGVTKTKGEGTLRCQLQGQEGRYKEDYWDRKDLEG